MVDTSNRMNEAPFILISLFSDAGTCLLLDIAGEVVPYDTGNTLADDITLILCLCRALNEVYVWFVFKRITVVW